jgi:hypothetical protein
VESFEQFVAVAMEAEGLIVSEAVKFPVERQTRKAAYTERQTHGYEVDLVGARADRLVLTTVKSFFGSRGVVAEHVMGSGGDLRSRNGYILLNDPQVRDSVVAAAANRYGYDSSDVYVRLYVGRFAAPSNGTHEAKIENGQPSSRSVADRSRSSGSKMSPSLSEPSPRRRPTGTTRSW